MTATQVPMHYVPTSEVKRLRYAWGHLAADAAEVNATAPVADVVRKLSEQLASANIDDGEPSGAGPAEPEELLTAQEAAVLLGVKPRWLYDHARTLPFARRLGARTVRFSKLGLERWLQTCGKRHRSQ